MSLILILGAGKSSYSLIRYLAENAKAHQYTLAVADGNPENLKEKTRFYGDVRTYCADLSKQAVLHELITEATIVVSLLPPSMHMEAALVCLELRKNLLTASYASAEMEALHEEVRSKDLTFIMECGLDPGLDHMSSMQIFDKLRAEKAEITGYSSWCGGLVSPKSDNNPWGYKITWNPRNVVLAGKGTARFLQGGQLKLVPYHRLFNRTTPLVFDHYGEYEGYPNRDSLSYIRKYGLENVQNFIRGTIRKKGFCEGWNALVQLGITDDSVTFQVDNPSVKSFIGRFLPDGIDYKKYLGIMDNSYLHEKLKFLGFDSEDPVPLSGNVSPADCLQSVLEDKWKLQPGDRDLVLMQHQISYWKENKEFNIISSLAVEGESLTETAMAMTVGLPLAITTLLLYRKKIENKGVIIPVLKEIYNPVLEELHSKGLIFREYMYS